MDIMTILERMIGVTYLATAVSLWIYRSDWLAWIEEFRTNRSLHLGFGMVAMLFGMFMTQVYNVWAWDTRVLVTIVGFGALIKGAGFLLIPRAMVAIIPPKETLARLAKIEAPIIGVVALAVLYRSF